MGRGSSKMGGGAGAGGQQPRRMLLSKSQVDELTKDFTPEMFLGDVTSQYNKNFGTLAGLRAMAENNAPDTLDIGGYTFKNMGQPHTTYETSKSGRNRDVVTLDYQSTEQITNANGSSEYPVLQVGVRVWYTPSGKVKSEIIRDGYTNKTRFW